MTTLHPPELSTRSTGRPPAPYGTPQRKGGARSDGGQMLLLSGVLLTLGFVIMGTTLVQLHNMEGSTERTQRDSLVVTVDELISGLNQTIQDSIVVGETNTTSFKETLRSAEKSLRDNAVRSGVYASIQLTTVPIDDEEMKQIFWRESRCIGYNPNGSEDGIIVGWEETTFEETIAGAIYEIHVTDGRQAFRSYVYIKIVDCAEIEITSTHTTMIAPYGNMEDPNAMRKQNGLSTNITEELDMDNLVEVSMHPTIDQDTIKIQGNWHDVDENGNAESHDADNPPQNILNLDGNFTRMSSNIASLQNIGNHFRFQIDPPERMKPSDTLPNVTLEVTGYKEQSDLLDLQQMYLNIYPNQSALSSLVPSVTKEIPLETGPSQTHEVVIEQLTPAQPNWTYSQMENSVWELTVSGDHQPSQHWYLDHFNMTGGLTMSQGYRMDLELDWQKIPVQYADHELFLRYRVDPATLDEGYLLEVRDIDGVIAGGAWMEVHNMTDTTAQPDGWHETTFTQAQGPTGAENLPNQPQFRIRDTIDTDNWDPEDEDTLRIDHLYIQSRLDT